MSSDIFWLDLSAQPQKGQWIFFISKRGYSNMKAEKSEIPDEDIIFYGKYEGDGTALVHEGCSRYVVEKWYPVPKMRY